MYTQEQKKLVLSFLEEFYEKQLNLAIDGEAVADPSTVLNTMELIMDSQLIRDELDDLQANKSDVTHTHDYAATAHTHTDLHTHQNKPYLDNINQNLTTTSRPTFTGIRSSDYALTFGGKPNNNAILVVSTEGNASQAEVTIYNKSDWSNSSRLRLIVNQSSIKIDSSNTGTGLLQNIVFSFNSIDKVRIAADGTVYAKAFVVE